MTDREYAKLYAAQKYIEAALKDRQMTPGVSFDLSGESVTIDFPEGATVSRSKGEDGKGNVFKKATQNLYGYAVWVFFLRRLALFNQAAHVRKLLMEAWEEAMRTFTKVETELAEVDPELSKFVESLKQIEGPKRREDSPRVFDKGKGQPVFHFAA